MHPDAVVLPRQSVRKGFSVTTIYKSKHGSRKATPQPGAKSNRSKKQFLVAVSLVAALALPAAAWAAVELFGFGTLDAVAATTQNLTVNNKTAQLVGKLIPGKTVGAKADVTNPNDFPVTVTAVIVLDKSLAVTPDLPACQMSVHIVGTPTTWPAAGGGAAWLQKVKENVTLLPGETKSVEVPLAVKQDLGASVLCGVHAEFAVRAQTAD